MNDRKILYLSRKEVAETGLTMAEVIEAVEQAFREKGEGKVEMPPKPGVHSRPDSFIHAMPAYIAATGALGIKWVAGYPENSKRGLPYISGLVVLNDPDTGLPQAVMDCVWITAMRTGAATTVAARYLAREDSKYLGVLGAGVQGFSNLEALKVLFPEARRNCAASIPRPRPAPSRNPSMMLCRVRFCRRVSNNPRGRAAMASASHWLLQRMMEPQLLKPQP